MAATKPLHAVHSAALALHKALLDVVRQEYEQANGPVGTPNAFLGLVLSHETFAWLRQLSGLIVETDEIDSLKDADERDLAAARAAFEELLFRSGPRFAEPYAAALDASADVAFAAAVLQRALTALPEPKEEDLPALAERRRRWTAPRER